MKYACSLYKQGLAHFFALPDVFQAPSTKPQINHQAAVGCFEQAYQLGDYNAGWMLARCYCYGYGVARDTERMYAIARELELQSYIGAGYYLALAYENGWGVEIDLEKVNDIAQHYAELCLAPSPEGDKSIDESIRQECLVLLTRTEEMEAEEEMAFYRSYLESSRFPLRFAAMAEYLIARNEMEHREEVLELLHEGSLLQDSSAMMLLGSIITSENHPYDIYNLPKGRDLLIACGEGYAQLARIAQQQGDEEQRLRMLDLAMQQARYGYSMMRGDGELSCTLRALPAIWSGLIKVYDHQVTRTLIKNQSLHHCVEQAPPRLLIEGIEKGLELSVRVRSASDDLDHSFTLIPAESTLTIDLAVERGIRWSDDLDIELSNTKGRLRALISAAIQAVASPFIPPPIVMSWRRRFLRGYSLQIFAFQGDVSELSVHLTDRVGSEPLHIPAEGFVELSGHFVGGKKLRMGEPFVLCCRGVAPCLAVIAPAPRGPQHFDQRHALSLVQQLAEQQD